jgi:hypothetical protein
MSPCAGVAPANSLVASPPKLGSHVSFAADDPAGTAGLTPGSLAFLAISGFALGTDPCGIVVPGLGPDGAPGELFLEPKGPVLTSAPWAGPGSAAVFDAALPASAALVGVSVRAQTVFVDAADGDLVLTEAVELLLAD